MNSHSRQCVNIARNEDAGNSPTETHPKPLQDFWSFSPSSCRRPWFWVWDSSRHQQTEAPRFIGIYHELLVQGSCPVQHLPHKLDCLSREISYIYILHGNGMMYVIEGRLITCFIHFLHSYIHSIFKSLTDHMPKIYFIANKATQRCKEDLKNQQWRENEGVLLVWFIASFLWLSICLASCIDSYIRFSLHDFSLVPLWVFPLLETPARLFYRNQYLYFYIWICVTQNDINISLTQTGYVYRYRGKNIIKKDRLNVYLGKGFDHMSINTLSVAISDHCLCW